MILNRLKGVIHPPSFLIESTQYLTLMGSQAYGVATPDSDKDVYGFCIPPKDIVYPHTAAVIYGFGHQGKRFDQWQEHHVGDYDFTVYSIVKYFQLLMQNNPNIIDSLFTPENCLLYQTSIGKLLRERRSLFLHKGAYHTFKGYAFSQLNKIRTKRPEGKRKEAVDLFGYDTKYAYHLVRLCDECEQILNTGTLNLRRDKNRLIAIRKGEWTIEKIERWFTNQEEYLEQCYQKSELPYGPNEEAIKKLLVQCLEMWYD